MTYVMSKLIPNVNECPFADLGLDEDDFVSLETILNKPVTIMAYKMYTKDDSPGVFMALEINGRMAYNATHSVALVKTFEDPTVKQILDDGEPIEATITKRTSKKTGRSYYCFANE